MRTSYQTLQRRSILITSVLSLRGGQSATHRLPLLASPLFISRFRSMSSSDMDVSSAAAHDLLSFIDDSPTPFHAVRSVRKMLDNEGFGRLMERYSWQSMCRPGGKYYLTRNGSAVVAFAIGGKWMPGNPIAMIGAHTDSPTLRIKPVSNKQGDGFIQVGVETYGGGLWHTWFDRDLSIAGRALVKSDSGNYVQMLIKVDRPILRIPTLAVHLDRQETFSFNKETQLFPIAGLVAAELNRQKTIQDELKPSTPIGSESTVDGFKALQIITERHHPYIVEMIAEQSGVDPSDVADFDMILYDTQKACIGGLNDELIFSARLDNLEMSYCSIVSLIKSLNGSSLQDDHCIRLVALFDHEEIGSQTAQGADSNFLPAILRRLSMIPSTANPTAEDLASTATAYEQTLSTSFLISADMAHSVHPNYAAKYESDHKPEMNKGTVIKVNANSRYATDSPGIALLQEVASRLEVPLQLFVVRNDSSCGSTIGPVLSAALGTRTVDLGNAQLSMHSIRETAGVYDVEYAIRLFESFFEHFGKMDYKFHVD